MIEKARVDHFSHETLVQEYKNYTEIGTISVIKSINHFSHRKYTSSLINHFSHKKYTSSL